MRRHNAQLCRKQQRRHAASRAYGIATIASRGSSRTLLNAVNSRHWLLLPIFAFLCGFAAGDARADVHYEPYTITTIAGLPPGSTDGTGSAARFRLPYGAAVDSGGNVYVADTFNYIIRKITSAGVASTFAGSAGSSGSADGTGSAARFVLPHGVAVDSAGNLYVADTYNQTIRKITSGGVVTTLAGSPGTIGSADGTGSAARFYYPYGVAVDSAGNVYVADTNNHTIRKITSAGVVTTLAGSPGASGSADGTGSAARFWNPDGVAVDSAGIVYVADTVNYTIRKITSGGVVTTLAGFARNPGSADGTGSAARFFNPTGVAVDSAGNVYVADNINYTIRKITSAGVVTTLAGSPGVIGSADGTGNAARFNHPFGLAVDSARNLFVADTFNSTIRKITSSGVATTFAGTASPGSADGTGSTARFFSPEGVAVNSARNVYVADSSNSTIRKITSAGVVTTLAGSPSASGSANGTGSAARFNYPNGLAADSAGNVYVADSGNDTIRKITSAGVVTTLAGLSGSSGSADGTGSAARFNFPNGIALDSAGNLYVGDTSNNTIRKITSAGTVSTVAGAPGSRGSVDGTGSAARFSAPWGVAVDSAGNVYVVDRDNYTIRKITSAGVVTTLAGSPGALGTADGTGSAARFYYPYGVAVDSAGNVYVAEDFTIRKITPAGVVTTLAGSSYSPGSADGTGSAAQFYYAAGVAVDSAGKVYVADGNNNSVRAGVRYVSPTPTPTPSPKATPTITTEVSNLGNPITVGQSINDAAWLYNGNNASGTVTFRVYGPDDNTCSTTPVFSSTNTVSRTNSTVSTAVSDMFTFTKAGTYRFIATYSGDANNAAVAGHCNDANESILVNPAPTPTPTPTATPKPTATATPIPTATPKPTATPNPTASPTPRPTETPTPTPTVTPAATPTPTVAPTATPTATPIPIATPTATPTATPIATATPSATPSATPLATPIPTATPVVTATPTPSPVPNTPPTIRLTTTDDGGLTPPNGTKLKSGQPFTMTAIASDDHGVASVAFVYDGVVLGRSTAVPYGFYTRLYSTGDHTLSARAIDDQGATTDSNAVTITVEPPLGLIYTFVGPAGSDWNNPANWSPAGVPGRNDLAELKSGQSVSLGAATVRVGGLTLAGNSAISGSGTLDFGNTFSFSGGTLSGVHLVGGLYFVLSGADAKSLTDVTIDNFNWLYCTGSGPITGNSGTVINNRGIFVINDAPITATFGAFNNSGFVQVKGRLAVDRYTQAAGQLDLNGYNEDGSLATALSVLQGTTITLNGGTLTGEGTIIGNLINNGAAIVPGHSAGSITVDGDYTQGPNASLNLEIGGTEPGQSDQFSVNGTAQLGGKLSIRTINNFTPDPTTTFTPLHLAQVSGDFASTSSNADVAVTKSGVEVKVVGPNPLPARAQNISTRLSVQKDENVLIGGFIITGPTGSTKTVAVRGIGPSLNGLGVSDALPDPLLELHQPDGSTLVNDNWKDAANASETNPVLIPSDDRESVLTTQLAPGGYTAILKGAHGETGVGLAEVYDLDDPSATNLANISTRGLVQTGDDVLIGGFIIGGTEPAKVLVRAIGPSLKQQGVQNPLEDPMLEVHDANGDVISNDDWRNTEEAVIQATTIPPLDDRESAVLSTLAPGNYTAVVRGKNDTSGVALVEIYMLP